MNGDRPTFLVDMDSTWVDWEKGFYAVVREVSERMGVEFPLPPGGLTSWVVTGGGTERDKVIDAAFAHPDLYDILEPFPGAVDAVAEMNEEGPTFFLTAPDHRNDACISAKLSTIERFQGSAWKDRAIFSRDKTLVSGDILWDDHPDIVGAVAVPAWQQVFFDNAWNRSLGGVRITDWSQWRTVASGIIGIGPG